jgi:4-hydroxy-tetrahydrodipicolinate reductase
MKIAIIGYGKMGKAIEEIALERGHQIEVKVDRSNADEIGTAELSKSDVAIEFSRPENAVDNIEKCIQAKLPIVVGTTGWYDEYDRISKEIHKAGSALLAATNFSVGVNLFFELNRQLALMMANHQEYKATITEIHHTQKLDSPSGTAITLAEGILESRQDYKSWVNDRSSEKDQLGIVSERIENVPGTHSINYSSKIDDIEIKHTAKSRKGFALGAVLAAEFLQDKKGVFTMKDVLKF